MKRKPYLSELIGDDYMEWSKKKIILTAPTGLGKTTFIVDRLLTYKKLNEKKMLILCNRKLLRRQYWFDLVEKFHSYTELERAVKIETYQHIAEMLRQGEDMAEMFRDYECIVLDECHYFYADAEFNGFGTFGLLQQLIYLGYGKQMIFMSATTDEVKPWIREVIDKYKHKNRRCENPRNYDDSCGEIVELNYSHLADYERFSCIAVEDENTLYECLAKSSYKSLVFIDDKEKADEMAAELVSKHGVRKTDISILNAENIDSDKNKNLVNQMTMAHRLPPKILITTAVLDNGVSLHDEDIKNVVVMTESKVSFIQMIGRVRAESVSDCNLYFLPKDTKIYERRMRTYSHELELAEQIVNPKEILYPYKYINAVWDEPESEMARLYRKIFVLVPYKQVYLYFDENRIWRSYGDTGLVFNEFAKRKIGDMYVAESDFYKKSVVSSLSPVYQQMKWIDKTELKIIESDYQKRYKEEFVDYLLTAKDFTVEKMKDFKTALVRKYRKDFFPDILASNGTLSAEKLQEICQRYQLVLKDREDSATRRKLYSIEREMG